MFRTARWPDRLGKNRLTDQGCRPVKATPRRGRGRPGGAPAMSADLSKQRQRARWLDLHSGIASFIRHLR
jgi:hypothetical protein